MVKCLGSESFWSLRRRARNSTTWLWKSRSVSDSVGPQEPLDLIIFNRSMRCSTRRQKAFRLERQVSAISRARADETIFDTTGFSSHGKKEEQILCVKGINEPSSPSQSRQIMTSTIRVTMLSLSLFSGLFRSLFTNILPMWLQKWNVFVDSLKMHFFLRSSW